MLGNGTEHKQTISDMKDPIVFVKHIIESIDLIQTYIKGKSKEDLKKNIQFQDAIFRRLEIIGEATKNLSLDFKEKYPEIPWLDMADTRNKIIHHYFGLDVEIIWLIIEKDLPELKLKLIKLLEDKH